MLRGHLNSAKCEEESTEKGRDEGRKNSGPNLCSSPRSHKAFAPLADSGERGGEGREEKPWSTGANRAARYSLLKTWRVLALGRRTNRMLLGGRMRCRLKRTFVRSKFSRELHLHALRRGEQSCLHLP